ncbi:glycosyltransferase [Frateuria aurantia]|uniref:Putative glycosyltransferase n=1 Tax=Frateuria aurantia (strain ATCC 33424 / DSM 6220 / KCTC 2777 / LMG 1558 / NBRC 3245 / NCIMB 13370) TaxID=767434 RepID=H8L3D2_FRAAD|nr:glycosyltransferase [Frateuria aurantia]AFC86454.1 putative glycosyltransferase [Frateuria aurantia DSM 6220]
MKYSIVACAVVDQVDDTLEAWLDYQHACGVEQVLLYLREMPEAWRELPPAHTRPCPWPEALTVEAAWAHACRRMQGRADWLLCQAATQYVYAVGGGALIEVLDAVAADIGQIQLGEMDSDDPAASVSLLRLAAMNATDAGLEMLSGWGQASTAAGVDDQAASASGLQAAVWPNAVCGAMLRSAGQPAAEWSAVIPAPMRDTLAQALRRQCGQTLSEALQPWTTHGASGPQALHGLEALILLLKVLAEAHAQPRALLLGDTPPKLAQAVLAAGYQLDLVEARTAQVRTLQHLLPAEPGIRLARCAWSTLDGDLDYALIVMNDGAYCCNQAPAADEAARSAGLARLLHADGVMLRVGHGGNTAPAVTAGPLQPVLDFQVMPDWQAPQVLLASKARSLLQAETAVFLPSSSDSQIAASLSVWGTCPEALKVLQGLVSVPASQAVMRRVQQWRSDGMTGGWVRSIHFMAPVSEVQAQLGPDLQFHAEVAVGVPAARRWLCRLREMARLGRLESFVSALRRWAGFLHDQADDQGLLDGQWFDALPAHVHEDAEGRLQRLDGEWCYRVPVDLRLVICLGLWQLASDSALHRLMPAASPMDKVRWLAALLDRDMPALWLASTARIHRLTGYGAGAGTEVAPTETPLPAYTAQLSEMHLRPAVVSVLRRRLEQGAGLPRLAVMLMGDDSDTAALQRSLLSLQATDYPGGIKVLATVAEGFGEDCLAVVTASPADWIFLLDIGDQLDVATAWIVADRVTALTGLQACYMDEDRIVAGQRIEPIFKPDFNLDLLRGYAYVGRGLVFRRSAWLELGGPDPALEAAAPAELLLRLAEQHGPAAIGHIAEALYSAQTSFDAWLKSPLLAMHWPQLIGRHLQRLGVAHELMPGPLAGSTRVRYLHAERPLVSIIIPTRNQLPLLAALIDSLLAQTAYPHFELLVVDNGSDDPDACRYLDGLDALPGEQIRVLRHPGVFNYSAMNNQAALQARGDYLLLLNNDTAMLEPGWLEAMLHHAQRPEVGIVGAKLYYPDGRVQHAGVVMGLDRVAGHPFIGSPASAGGYMQRLKFDQQYSAVTAACMMIRAEIYHQVGGLDAADLTVSYNDIDLCLKVQQAGYLIVWTPHAHVMHHGSVSQRQLDEGQQAAKRARFRAEQEVMYRRWLPWMAADPAYNRNLSLSGHGFELDPYRHIAWQPLVTKVQPRVVCHPADRTGCGHYRVRQPFAAMHREEVLEGTVTEALLLPVTLARFETDAIILQRQHTDAQREALRRYLRFSDAFKVYELDDYMFNLPMKSVHRGAMPKDLRKQLRQAVAMTDRFVVSTQVLAEQFADMHDDIRVVLNRLPTDWWSGLKAERRAGAKPRVGWGGGSSHTGDLELIADVVRELADEVDWVFFGMCPDKLKPYVKEFHTGVPIEQYPAKLASLNLDLAVAPLEDNLFNHCKSNLRLLEYGACGFPVVCSDLITYRGDLPVTRVKNRFKDWVAAIRMHVADLDATAAMGDALRDAVMRDWTLTGQNLVEWRDAWLPD